LRVGVNRRPAKVAARIRTVKPGHHPARQHVPVIREFRIAAGSAFDQPFADFDRL